MTVAEKLTVIAQNEQKVYDAGFAKGASADYEDGQNAAMSEFWDAFTDNGKRTKYSFAQWGHEYIRPTRRIEFKTVDGGSSTFNACLNLKKVEAGCFDFSQKPRGARSTEGYSHTFYKCESLEEIGDIGMTADFDYNSTFRGCKSLHTIAKIRCDENTLFSNTFLEGHDLATQISPLKNITFEGVIGQNITFTKQHVNLSADSIRSIIEHLSDTASGKTLTLSKKAVESADFSAGDIGSWDELIATKPNWTISLV